MSTVFDANVVPSDRTTPVRLIIARLKNGLTQDLRGYPYPIVGCDEVFKTLVHQKECCRIALAGLTGEDGLTPDDAAKAIAELLATPIALQLEERLQLMIVTRQVM